MINRDDLFCRKATLADALKIACIHVETWQVAYKDLLPANLLADLSIENRRAMWERMINADSNQARLLVAGWGDQIQGFVAAGPARDTVREANLGEISAIYVDSTAWGSSLGYRLMNDAREFLHEREHKQVQLWVLDGNERAIKFYKRFGFVRDDSEKGVKLEQMGNVTVRELRYLLTIK